VLDELAGAAQWFSAGAAQACEGPSCFEAPRRTLWVSSRSQSVGMQRGPLLEGSDVRVGRRYVQFRSNALALLVVS